MLLKPSEGANLGTELALILARALQDVGALTLKGADREPSHPSHANLRYPTPSHANLRYPRYPTLTYAIPPHPTIHPLHLSGRHPTPSRRRRHHRW